MSSLSKMSKKMAVSVVLGTVSAHVSVCSNMADSSEGGLMQVQEVQARLVLHGFSCFKKCQPAKSWFEKINKVVDALKEGDVLKEATVDYCGSLKLRSDCESLKDVRGKRVCRYNSRSCERDPDLINPFNIQDFGPFVVAVRDRCKKLDENGCVLNKKNGGVCSFRIDEGKVNAMSHEGAQLKGFAVGAAVGAGVGAIGGAGAGAIIGTGVGALGGMVAAPCYLNREQKRIDKRNRHVTDYVSAAYSQRF